MTTFDELTQRLTDLESKQLDLDDLPIAQLQRRLEQRWLPDAVGDLTQSAIPLVSSLPTATTDGAVIDYLADAANGVMWRLRYRAAGLVYKWEFIGGSSLVVEQNNWPASPESSSTAGYQPFATVRDLTLPLAGDYDIALEHQSYNTAASATNHGYLSYAIGAAAANDADAALVPYSGANMYGLATRERRKTGLAAGTVLGMRLRPTGGTMAVMSRRLSVRPVRVG